MIKIQIKTVPLELSVFVVIYLVRTVIDKMESEKKNSPEIQVLHANVAFTNDLYKLLSEAEGNVFFSPISIHIVLAMLYHGAEGETAQVLSHALKSADAEGYRRLIGRLNAMDSVQLMMANKLYSNKSNNKILKDFEDVLKGNFYSELEFLDMENQKVSAKTVNDWVETKTDHKIKNIVNEPMFTRNLSLILINAIYFNGKWASQFKSSMTRKGEFFMGKNEPKEVEMMFQKHKYNYKLDKELNAQILEVPYKGLNTSMIIILPSEESDMKNLENKLIKYDLNNVWKDMTAQDVNFYLPKFKMEATMNLNDILREMGLANIFDMKLAKFTKIIENTTPHNNIHVSEIIQKAYIKVDEAGTEAAAATRAAMLVGCARQIAEPVLFKVNRPAVFMLVASHGDDKSVLFYGRLAEPKC